MQIIAHAGHGLIEANMFAVGLVVGVIIGAAYLFARKVRK